MTSIDLNATDRAKIQELCAVQLKRVQVIRERSNPSCTDDLVACVNSYRQLLNILAQRDAAVEILEDPVSSSTAGGLGQLRRTHTVVGSSKGSSKLTTNYNKEAVNSQPPSVAKSRKFLYRVLPMLIGAVLAFLAHKFIEIRLPRKQSR